MQNALFGFDMNDVDTTTVSREPLPVGWYKVYIDHIEKKVSKANAENLYISLKFIVTEGEYAERIVWQNFNIFNKNETTQKIARQRMHELCMAIDNLNASSEEDFFGKLVSLDLRVNPPKGEYGASNNVYKIDKYEREAVVDDNPMPAWG